MFIKTAMNKSAKLIKSFCSAIFNTAKSAACRFGSGLKYLFAELPASGFRATANAFKASGVENGLKRCRLFFKHIGLCVSSNRRKFVKLTALAAAVVLVATVAATSGIWSRVRVAVRVKYNDEYIGTIRSAELFNDTVKSMRDRIVYDGSDELITKATFDTVLVFEDEIESPTDLTDKALSHTDGITEAYGLFVNGELCSASEDQNVYNTCMNNKLSDAQAAFAGQSSSVSFCEEVKVEKAYFSDEVIENQSEIENEFNDYPLTVMVSVEEVTETEVPFETVENKDDKKVQGYRKVTSAGSNGTARTVSNVCYVDGAEVSRTVISTENIVEPVAEQVTVGTATTGTVSETHSMSAAKEDYSSYGFTWPVAKNSKMRVTCYYGDGRNHKGMDIVSPAGTAIYSVADGVVISAGYNAAGSGFGNCVLVEHSNGLRTLYAHCSELYVSAGDVVKRGEQIAAVGNTGDSDGNHLHFEVRVGGNRVDPAPYLGINR